MVHAVWQRVAGGYYQLGTMLAVGQNQWCHFGVGAPPILVYFSRDWDVHWVQDFDPWPYVYANSRGLKAENIGAENIGSAWRLEVPRGALRSLRSKRQKPEKEAWVPGYPKWNPGKWKHGLKSAVPWWFNFDPYPNTPEAWGAMARSWA